MELGRESSDYSCLADLFLYKGRSWHAFVREMAPQRVALSGRQGTGSRGRRDGVARAGEEQAAGLVLATSGNPNARLHVVCDRAAKIPSERGLQPLRKARNFQPFSRPERWSSARGCAFARPHGRGSLLLWGKIHCLIVTFYSFLPLGGNSSNTRHPQMDILGKLLGMKVSLW